MVFPAHEHIIKTLRALHDIVPETEKTKSHVLLLAGEATPFRNDTDREMPFRQESNFYYLTGCQVPSSLLLITFAYGTSLESNPTVDLFIPPVSEDDMTWSVPPPTAAEAADLFPAATKILPTNDMLVALSDIFTAFPGSILHTLPQSRLYPTLPPDFLLHDLSTRATSDYLLTALAKARLIKSPWEIAQIRKANDISSRAHETIMRVLALGVTNQIQTKTSLDRPHVPGEWTIESEPDAEAIFVASCLREGARQAYLPIVASSVRSSTLHYCCNDKGFSWGPPEPPARAFSHPNLHAGGIDHAQVVKTIGGQLTPQVLLIDAGCEWECYNSDITRVTPVGNGGKFTPEARAIYSLVLEMQEESIKTIKPGLHWDAIQLLCHRILIKGFIGLGIFKKDASEGDILNSGISGAFYPHGVGHSLGLDVHDVPTISKPASGEGISKLPEGMSEKAAHAVFRFLRLRVPLEEGMVVTVEPGIYFSPHLLAPIRDSEFVDPEVLAKYEVVGGVRIEDAVAITSDGCEVLTKVGKSADWVERVSSGQI